MTPVMYCNLNFTDKMVRIGLGIVLLFVLALVFETYWLLLGWLLIASGLLEFFPLYALFGFSTRQDQKKFWA